MRLKIPCLPFALAICLAGLATPAAADNAAKPAPQSHPGEREFIAEVLAEAKTARPELDRKTIEGVLSEARYQQSIIDAITRPAEAKPWRDYRPIFLTDKRIADGARFYRENAELLDAVGKRYGVPPEIIVAIVGVETNYGRLTGRYRVIDALTTLAFYYPQRAPFFRGELKQLLLLPPKGFPQPLDQLMGSYAGAMGWGQFMPTSFAKFALDEDGDQHIDLWASKPDIFASIANYFVGHGWVTGEPVAFPAELGREPRAVTPENMEPVYSVGQLGQWGYRAVGGEDDPNRQATLLKLEGPVGSEYWITHQNFFVITRYNRSPLYAMAVYQLSQAIAAQARAEVARS